MSGRLISILAPLVLLLPAASAYPTKPGFCDVSISAMEASSMGPASGMSDDGGFGLTFSKSSGIAAGEVINITLTHTNGTGNLKGILLVSKMGDDAAGEFTEVPAGGFQIGAGRTDCTGDTTARIGHDGNDVKTTPLTFSWKTSQSTNHNATFEMIIVVSDSSDWYAITSSEHTVQVLAAPATTTAATTTAAPTTAAPTTAMPDEESTESSEGSTVIVSFWTLISLVLIW